MSGALPTARATRAGTEPTSSLGHSAGIANAGDYKLPVDYTSLEWWERKAVREQYVRQQNGLCSHCGGLLSDAPVGPDAGRRINTELFPPNFFKYPVHLHHCHSTGMTIGAVHNHCNAALWQYHGE